MPNEYIQSPLNYTGGKFKLLPQLFDLFPNDINVFYDIFSGGANVCANVDCEFIKAIDNNEHLVSLLIFLQKQDFDELHEHLTKLIQSYNLSYTYKNGYDFYKCNSSDGLGKYNKESYVQMREDYNKKPSESVFLLLIIYGFNNQIRFNSKSFFNMPVGKRDFNASIQKKLKKFITKIQTINIEFINQNFVNIDKTALVKEQAFIYLDPPYLLGTASYNENGGWTEKNEKELFDFLLFCNESNLRFALSNVIEHKGETHDMLYDFCSSNSFTINHMEHTYSNANYQLKNKNQKSKEVLITNYH